MKSVLNSVCWLVLIFFTYSCKKTNSSNYIVTVCSQGWDIKNLDVITYRNGDPIPQVTNALAWSNLTTGAWCWYNNDSATYSIFGKLYNWYAVNDPRGLAPMNWHIPNDHEWNVMTKCIDNTVDTSSLGWSGKIAGGSLKDLNWWFGPNSGARNNTGFSALPGGYRLYFNGEFYEVGHIGSWWSASEFNASSAWNRALSHDNSKIYRYSKSKIDGFSVRVVRD